MGMRVAEPNTDRIIVVPDLAAVDLTALVKSELNLTYVDSMYESWNFWESGFDHLPISGRGKRFEWDLWKPGREVTPDDVCRYFEAKGFYGHGGAFTQWRRVCGLQGHHGTVPDLRGCCHGPYKSVCVPCSYFVDNRRYLELRWVGSYWREEWSLVAFRELP